MTNPIYAVSKCPNRSEKYHFISTANMLDYLGSKGWEVKSTKVARIIKNAEVREGFQKHGIVLQNQALPAVDGILPRIILTNSHDGTSSFQFRLGLFRVACANGLVVSMGIDSVFRIRHTNVTQESLDNAINFILEQFAKATERVKYFMARQVSREEAIRFANEAFKARFGDRVLFDATRLLDIRREEDIQPTLWNVLNVIQENVVKGGQVYAISGTKKKQNTTREIKGIDSNIKVNEAIWQIAESIAA